MRLAYRTRNGGVQPGGVHTSVALHDALEAAELPVVEVHHWVCAVMVVPSSFVCVAAGYRGDAGAGAYGYVMAV